MAENQFVLRPLSLEELNGFFNTEAQELIRFFIKKSLFSQPELKWEQKGIPIQIPKEHIEQWLVQALNVDGIGAGSYAIDLLCESQKWGADVKMLSAPVDKDWNLSTGDSWETSLAQKFKETWKDLDTMFQKWRFEEIKQQWLGIYQRKLEEVISAHWLEHIYYFILLRGADTFYFAWMEVCLENLKNTTVNVERTRKESIFIDGFIDDKYWNIKIYKAKKRLELRLHPLEWNNQNVLIAFPMNFTPDRIELLSELKKWVNPNEIARNLFKKIFT